MAGSANLDASVEGYDSVLVTLLGDVATNYVNLRVTSSASATPRKMWTCSAAPAEAPARAAKNLGKTFHLTTRFGDNQLSGH
jgi:hypothetical protein